MSSRSEIEIDLDSSDLLKIAFGSAEEHNLSEISKSYLNDVNENSPHDHILRALGHAYINDFLIKAVEDHYKNNAETLIEA